MDLQAALTRANELNCQLKYDRCSVQTFDGQRGILVTRVPAACYRLHPQDDKFQQGSILVFVNDEMTPELFEQRLELAITRIEENFCSAYPNEREERQALIRKRAH